MADLPAPDFNMPYGVRVSDDYFNPPICRCGEEAQPGEECIFCGEYVPDENEEDR